MVRTSYPVGACPRGAPGARGTRVSSRRRGMRGTAPRAPAGIFPAGRGQYQTPGAVAEFGSARGPPVVRAERRGGRPSAGLVACGPCEPLPQRHDLDGRPHRPDLQPHERRQVALLAQGRDVVGFDVVHAVPPPALPSSSSLSGGAAGRLELLRGIRGGGTPVQGPPPPRLIPIVPEQEVPSPCRPGDGRCPPRASSAQPLARAPANAFRPADRACWFTLRRRLAGCGRGELPEDPSLAGRVRRTAERLADADPGGAGRALLDDADADQVSRPGPRAGSGGGHRAGQRAQVAVEGSVHGRSDLPGRCALSYSTVLPGAGGRGCPSRQASWPAHPAPQ